MKDRKKIAILIYNNYDKDLRAIREAETLREYGYKPVVFCCTNKPEEEKKIYIKNGIIVLRMIDRLPYIDKNPIKFLPFFSLRKFVMKYPEKFDLIHCHDLNAALVGYSLSRKLNIPLICDFHELFISYLKHHKNNNLLKKIVLYVVDKLWTIIGKRIVQYARGFITVNDSLAEIYQKKWKLNNKPIVLYNYNRLKSHSKIRVQKDYFRKEFKIPEKKKILIFQGTLFYDKGVDVILSAFRTQKKYAIVFLGMGALVNKIKAYARNYPEVFYYHPPVLATNLIEYTKCADAGLAPIGKSKKSHIYSSPNKIYEYIAAGIPFVCAKLPEMIKIVDESKVGIAVPSDSPEALYAGVETLFQSGNFALTKQAIQKEFKTKYSWESEQKKLIKLYEDIINS